VRLETRPSNIEGKGRIKRDRPGPQRVANAARPDHYRRVPRSRSARHASGHEHRHEGSLTTIHANSPRDAVSRWKR